MKKKLVLFTVCLLGAVIVFAILAIADVSKKESSRQSESKQVITTASPAASATTKPMSQPPVQPTAVPTVKPTTKPTPAPIARVTSVPANAELISSAKIVLRNEPGTTNAKVAAKIVNGYVLKAGETFSYNGVVGERTTARGFINGHLPIKVTDKKTGITTTVDTVQPGSGVCRLSVGLVTAAKNAGLVLSPNNQPHDITPWYFATNPGLVDATVYWDGNIDSGFTNNKDYDILIQCDVTNYVLHVNFYKLT